MAYLAHQVGQQNQQFAVLGTLPTAALKRANEPTQSFLGNFRRITDQNGADRGATNQGQFERQRLHGAVSAREDEAAHHEDDHKNKTNQLGQDARAPALTQPAP